MLLLPFLHQIKNNEATDDLPQYYERTNVAAQEEKRENHVPKEIPFERFLCKIFLSPVFSRSISALAMATAVSSMVDLSSLSLYKVKSNSISSLASQLERRREVLARQKDKRDERISQLRLPIVNSPTSEEVKAQWPPRHDRKKVQTTAPIDMMLAEWLFCAPEDISTWIIIPCPLGRRCLVVVQSHRAQVYSKSGHLIGTMFTDLPKQTILYCIYDHRSSIYHIIDLIMWNGQDYSIQMECQCRFFMLTSLAGDGRLTEQFQILPRLNIEEGKELLKAEDGYLLYHPLGFYETGYSPLVCWLKPFMIEEMLRMKLSSPAEKPDGYTTAQAYMFEEQTSRKEQQEKQQQQQQQSVSSSSSDGKSRRRKSKKKEDELMSVD